MTREEFLKHAEAEIEQAFSGQRNRMMNLVQQAWAEGKRNAEVNDVASVVKEAIEKWQKDDMHDKPYKSPLAYTDGVPDACKNCSNHPSNGGSGNCNCMLGIMGKVTC